MRFLGVECIRKNIPMRNVTDTQYPYVINNPSYDTDTWFSASAQFGATYIYLFCSVQIN